MDFLTYCIAQRQVGETALNDNSSRSHQIIRLVSFMAIISLDACQTKYCHCELMVTIFWMTNADNRKYSPRKFRLRQVFCC